MHIFIDESGTFAIPAAGQTSPCIVGALIVPNYTIDRLFQKYERLRQHLPKEGDEVKGRRLNEAQVNSVITLLRRNHCLFEAIVIEMGRESATDIAEHQQKAAEALTANLTEKHHPELVAGVKKLKSRLEAMALPLYVQAALMNVLLARIIRELPAYWIQRQPKEILNFHWVVDGKGVDSETSSENWWSTTKAGFLQSALAREPVIMLDWLDYAAFDNKYLMPMPDYLKETILPYEHGYNLKLILEEDFRFNSGVDYGLELADIVTNTTRRALKGNLGPEGWRQIPALMIAREQALHFCSLSKAVDSSHLPYRDVVMKAFRHGGRDMLTAASRR
ncbi:hypothetical protein [Sphingopyxis chilensis]|uniref:hypothetical protein n=1 Tax=Sphingopyxis chilensis TaxID=180400 RepID=UPI002DDCCEC2|nr:hypothetical protein [Sphingopyxis chilensis]